MSIEKYDPKSTLSYLAIIPQIIQDYTMFKSPSDILTRFGNDYVIDVTDTPEREPLKSIQPLPEDFLERAFQFKESKKRRGIIEAAFHKNRLVNLRATMYFYGWFPRTAAGRFFLRELLPMFNNMIGSQGDVHDYPDLRYARIMWSDFKGLTVGVACHREEGYVSAYATDANYLEYF